MSEHRGKFYGASTGLEEFTITIKPHGKMWRWEVDSSVADHHTSETESDAPTLIQASRDAVHEVIRRCAAETTRALELMKKIEKEHEDEQ